MTPDRATADDSFCETSKPTNRTIGPPGGFRLVQIIPLTNRYSTGQIPGTKRRPDVGTNGLAGSRTETVEIRLTIPEKTDLRAAAVRAGLALSTWSRMLLLREAKVVTK